MLKRPSYEYQEDYYIHSETTNVSFIKTAVLLKRAGVKNYDFMLKLYDKDLINIDPYDPDISLKEMGKVVTEMSKNYWYYLREIARVPVEGSSTDVGGGSPFLLHRGNLAQAWCYEYNISHFFEAPRQFGKTTGSVQRYEWQFSYGTTASTTIFMNMDKAASVSNLTRLKESRALLPEYLQMVYTLDDKGNLKKDIDNVNEIKNKKLKNTIITKASARNVQNAERIGRGLTVGSLWFDELGHTLFNDTIWTAAIPAFSKASENAASNNKPYAISITTTPGDLDTAHGAFAFDLKEKAAKFTESLYDYDPDEIHIWLQKNSSNKLVYISFSFLQLGKTMEWFEEQCRLMNNNWVKIRRELLLQWIKSSSNSPFDPQDIDELDAMAVPAIGKLKINKYYEILLYKELDPYKKYLITVDVSKGIGRDSTAIAITDPDSLEIVGSFINNTIRSRELKRFLHTLILDHLPNAVLIIENNNIGDAIIEDLLHTPLKHYMYCEFVERIAETEHKDGFVQKRKKTRLMYGHEVTVATRPKMMELLLGFVSKHKKKLAVRELVDQIRHLEYNKAATRIDHASGHHDDLVMAYLAGIYIMFYGKNLSRFGLFNKFNFDSEEGIAEKEVREDKLKKILNKSKLRKAIESNPYLEGLFHDLVTATDLDKQLDQEIIDLEVNDYGESNTIYETDSFGHRRVMKPNAIKNLNKINFGRLNGLNKTTNEIFGIGDNYTGRKWN